MDELAALRLQIEWGADEAIADAPQNRMRAEPPSAPAREWAAVTAPPARQAQAEAEAAARASSTLAELESAVAGFTGCTLRDTAFRLVFGEGNPTADLMLIGEVPGADEDRAGRPFAGPAGAYLDKMLASIGLARAELRIGMLVPWRPPGGRPPTASEVTLCLPFLLRHIALVDPARLVLLGPLAARALLPPRPRGRRTPRGWVDTAIADDLRPKPALALESPAAVLAKPANRRAAWADLRMLRRALSNDMSTS